MYEVNFDYMYTQLAVLECVFRWNFSGEIRFFFIFLSTVATKRLQMLGSW